MSPIDKTFILTDKTVLNLVKNHAQSKIFQGFVQENCETTRRGGEILELEMRTRAHATFDTGTFVACGFEALCNMHL